MDSPRQPKEFLHMDVETDGIGTGALAEAYNDGWDLFAPPAWDSSSRVWRILLYRDAVAPVPVQPEPPKTSIIAEATPTVVIPPVVVDPPASAIEQHTTEDGAGESVDETPLEEESPTPITVTQPPVIVVMPAPFTPTDFGAELRRIKADTTLSPMEKIAALKEAGDTIAVNKAREAGELAWNAWNKLYPASPNFRLLPEEVKS